MVENRAGVNGSMAAGYVATQAPDGYTILLGTQSNLALNRFSYAKLSYDTEKSFAGVGMLATTPQVLVVNSEVPANNVADFVKLAKAAPGKYSFSSAGKGNSTHLNMEIFAKHFQLDMLSVPYKGSVVAIIFQQAGGLRASMGYCGCATIEDMRDRAEFVEITAAGIRESHVHDVQITKEAPNYRAD